MRQTAQSISCKQKVRKYIVCGRLCYWGNICFLRKFIPFCNMVQYTDYIALFKQSSVPITHCCVPHRIAEFTIFQNQINRACILKMKITEKSAAVSCTSLRHWLHCKKISEWTAFRCFISFEKEIWFCFKSLFNNLRYYITVFSK